MWTLIHKYFWTVSESIFLVVFPKESIRNGWHRHHGPTLYWHARLSLATRKINHLWLEPCFDPGKERGWLQWGGWNVNVPWLVQGRLVAIFGRDPGEVQARSRRDHKTIQIPSPVLACVSSTVFSAHFVSLFQSFRSRAGYKCLPA